MNANAIIGMISIGFTMRSSALNIARRDWMRRREVSSAGGSPNQLLSRICSRPRQFDLLHERVSRPCTVLIEREGS